MKRLAVLILLAIIIFPFPFTEAKAAETTIKYSRALDDTTGFYDRNGNLLFYVPYSYYVKIIGEEGDSAKAVYQDDEGKIPEISGYVQKSKIHYCDYVPDKPYLSLTAVTTQASLLYTDCETSYAKATVSEVSPVYYYGEIKVADRTLIYCFTVDSVSGKQYVGYLDKENVSSYTVRLNTDPIESDTESVTETFSDNKADNTIGNAVQILIIAGISVVAISIVYLLFRPSEDKVKEQVVSRFEDDK